MKHIIIAILTLLAAMLPCHSAAQERLIILNEGLWQSDNGKVSYFENGRVVSNQWFRDINGQKLGDTPSDIIRINDNLLAISVNWSNIIQFITPKGKAVAATENVPNNRCLATDGRYVYVSSYGHECATINGMVEFTRGFVAKIDITTFKVVATCEVGYEPEGIALHDGHLFVANTGGYAFQENHDYERTVSIIDASTMKRVRDIDTGQINLYGKMSKSGKYLCINSPGDYYDTPAATIILDCEAALKGDAKCFRKLDYAATYNSVATNGSFYAIGARYSYYTGEYEFNYLTINTTALFAGAAGAVQSNLPGSVLSDIRSMQMPYGIYVNPYTGYIYATDAASFVEGGMLYQWSPEGKLLGKYGLYINPGHFVALPPDGYDGIDSVEADEADGQAVIYNLQGIPVENPQSGHIYIVNGKKILY